MVANNMTAFHDGKIWIWLEASKKVFFTTATYNLTKADSMFLQTGETPNRNDFLNRPVTANSTAPNKNFIWEHMKPYWNYTQKFLYTDSSRDCPPPYND